MKKYIPLLAVMLLASTAAQAYTSPYSYRPRNAPVEVDMSALDEIGQHPAPAEPAPSMRQTSSAIINDQPAALTPAGTPAPAGSTTDFLDKIMSYHTAGDVKKKSADQVTLTPPPAPLAKPMRAPLLAPVAKPMAAPVPAPAAPEPLLTPKTTDVKPVAEPVPAAAPTPPAAAPAPAPQPEAAPAPQPVAPAAEAAPKAEEKPVDTAPKAEEPKAEAPKAEESAAPADAPAAPLTRNNRKSPPATQAADMTVSFATSIGNLSPEQEASLDSLAAKLKAAPGQRLQLRAFATDAGNDASNARRLSLSRGLAVRAYLIEKGVDPTAIDVRALGFNAEKPSDTVEAVLVK